MTTHGLLLLALIAILGLPNAVFAQKKFALMIGVNQYDHDKLRPLKFAVNDAVVLGAVLEKQGYQVTYLTDTQGKTPTKENIDAALTQILNDFQKGDTILLGMAGHGMQFGKEAYFCPKNAKPFEDEVRTMIPLGGIWGQLDRAFSGTKLVLVDACRDDGTRGIRGGVDGIPLPPEGVGVLLSCSKGQVAYEDSTLKHGVFFHHVIEAMTGAAKNEANEVTWDRLREYVKLGVPRKVTDLYGVTSGAKQNPNEMGNLTTVPVLAKIKIESNGPKAGEERELEIALGVKMKFCWIPAGEAQLGSTQEQQDQFIKIYYQGKRNKGVDEVLAEESESARGKFKTGGFWLGKYEVTQNQWVSMMGKNPSKFVGGQLPVEMVNWNDCQAFLGKCTIRGFNVQLPHEDQWEYACQGGKGNKQLHYLGDMLTSEKANIKGTAPKEVSLNKTSEIGAFEKVAPHPWGLCDMHGNVNEWCENYSNKGLPYREYRGGSWNGTARSSRSASRFRSPPEFSFDDVGFRVCLIPASK